MGKDGDKTITADKTVKKATADDKIIALTAPEKTPVQNINQLTAEEKEKVKEAVKKSIQIYHLMLTSWFLMTEQ